MHSVTTPFGILNVNKPAGLTSRDAVNRIERLTIPAKCGHAGTLDPLATGVLVVCIGRATRLIQYVQQMPKEYRATFLLGRRSYTDDLEGDVELLPDAARPSLSAVEATLPQFLGEIQQRPPAHSAIKVDGQRAYELARRGEAFDLPARTITVHRLEILRYEYPELDLAIECGSGTYVRSLGRDLAAALGTAAVMSALVRTATGEFRIENAVPLDDVSAETLPQHLLPPLSAVAHLPRVTLSDRQMTEIRHGRPILVPSRVHPTAEAVSPPLGSPTEWAAVDPSGALAAILAEKQPGQLWPARNFLA